MPDALAEELIAMSDVDHEAQAGAFSDDLGDQARYRDITTRNGDRLAEILAEHGWPTARLVGEEASKRAWLIAQHADRQLGVQRRALELLGQAVSVGEAPLRQLAFLEDRVRVNEGRKQRYGTQVGQVKDGRPVPWPVEDPERMDELRAEAGIAPFDEHVKKHAPR